LLFPDIFDRPVVAAFDQRPGSPDGGAVLLKAANQRLGLTSALAACLKEERQPGKILHEIEELLTQRVMGMALGYEDANDAARLACDPVHKLLVGRDPVKGEDLASQPTLSRFENAPDRKELFRMGEALADCVIERHRKRLHGCARRITIDLDPTDDPTHGQQQFTFFNSYYDCHCYLPAVCFLTFNGEVEQYLVAAVLRPGNASGSCGAIGILRRLLQRLNAAFPGVVFRVRLDERRILYKAEVTRHPNRDPKDNPRFVVTNMKQSPQWLYEEVYCQRGDIENRIKELHYGMEIGRTSCTSFWANQFRVLMTAAAYVLMQELRLRLARTDCARAQVSTLRERFLKLGVQVVATVRRIVLHLPQAFPYREHFYRLALSLGAQTG